MESPIILLRRPLRGSAAGNLYYRHHAWERSKQWTSSGSSLALLSDYTSARAWYERLMGRPPDFNPHDNEAVWQILENGWIYLVADTDRAGKALLTLMVDNLDRHVAELQERGLAVGAIETQPGLYRKAEVTDLEGNKISFGQALSPGNG